MRLFARALGQAGLTFFHLIRPEILAANLKVLEQQPSRLCAADGIVFLGCLATMHDEERVQFNAARNQLLQLPTKMIFVESVADEGKVRLGFPDVLSLMSYDCRLFQRDEENLFDPAAWQQADANGEKATHLSGVVHEVHEADAVCWLEVGPGVRVKFSVPLTLLSHLNPQPGLKLLWDPGKEGESPRFWKYEPEPPNPQLLDEFEKLSRRFHEDLKHRKPRLPKDE
jgi:hypothetical protein